MIGIVNYGSGNIQALANIYARLNIPCSVASTPDELAAATKIILPGVGAFDQAMDELERSGLRRALDAAVLEHRVPLLGICVGMQLLARSSEEGTAAGLGWIDGVVKRFDESTVQHATRLPHMGWNTADPAQASCLFDGVDLSTGFYFLHSYHFVCHDPRDILCSTDYGSRFTSAVRRGNIHGVQFHPEKSHHAGVQLLKNFALAA